MMENDKKRFVEIFVNGSKRTEIFDHTVKLLLIA